MCCISMVESWWVTEKLIIYSEFNSSFRLSLRMIQHFNYATFIELHYLSQWQLRGSEKMYGE